MVFLITSAHLSVEFTLARNPTLISNLNNNIVFFEVGYEIRAKIECCNEDWN